jgi:valyl-tRNA synthetase
MSKQRRRNTTLTIRLTKVEKKRIERNAKRAERSITDYIVLLSLEMPIHVAEDVKPLLIELKRIGNNLNQIAAKINSGVFRSYDFQDVVDEQKKIYEQLLEIVRKG